MSMFNKGGQQRTIQASCGWCRKGHPNEVNKLLILHKKYCKGCAESEYEAPAFNKDAGNINGWNGIRSSGNSLVVQSTCLVDGKRIEVISEAPSIEKAVTELQLDENRDKIISMAEMLPDKKKKNKRKKGKKNAEPLVSIHFEKEEDAEEEVKKNLISGAMEMYIPPNILHYLLDREIDEEELVDFLMKYMPSDKLELLMSELAK